jgi:hypothetical protein
MRITQGKTKTQRNTSSPKSMRSGRSQHGQEREVMSILQAQRTIGNRNVLQLLRSTEAGREGHPAISMHPGYPFIRIRKPLSDTKPVIQRDTSTSSPYRKRLIANKQYKMYLRDISHFNPDTRFTGTVRKKWLRILNAYCAGYLKDTKYITISDMKYNQQSDFDVTIKNMVDVTWQNGDNPIVLANKLNRLDTELNAAKRFMKKMTQPSGFVGKRWVREFHKQRHDDLTSFMRAGSWTHVFSWIKWLTSW